MNRSVEGPVVLVSWTAGGWPSRPGQRHRPGRDAEFRPPLGQLSAHDLSRRAGPTLGCRPGRWAIPRSVISTWSRVRRLSVDYPHRPRDRAWRVLRNAESWRPWTTPTQRGRGCICWACCPMAACIRTSGIWTRCWNWPQRQGVEQRRHPRLPGWPRHFADRRCRLLAPRPCTWRGARASGASLPSWDATTPWIATTAGSASKSPSTCCARRRRAHRRPAGGCPATLRRWPDRRVHARHRRSNTMGDPRLIHDGDSVHLLQLPRRPRRGRLTQALVGAPIDGPASRRARIT